jgi:hypothetical protein
MPHSPDPCDDCGVTHSHVREHMHEDGSPARHPGSRTLDALDFLGLDLEDGRLTLREAAAKLRAAADELDLAAAIEEPPSTTTERN